MSAPAQPRITTLIPTYRRPTLLRRAIESALEQGGPEVRVCVYDNASGDETGAVVSQIAARDPRLSCHRHDGNIGAFANFEFALRQVETPYFSILSDDDYLLPGFYQRALTELEAEPAAMFWAGMTLAADEAGKIWYARVDQWPREGYFAPPEGLMAMLHGLSPLWTGVVFRRNVLDGIGLPDPEVLGPADLDFVLRAASRYPYILRKHPSAVFTLHQASFGASQPLSAFWPGWLKMFRNIGTDAALSPDVRAGALQALHEDGRRMLFRRGANALAAGRRDFSREAAAAFEAEYGPNLKTRTLRACTALCEKLPGFQRLYTFAYRWAERRLIASRSDLETRFGHLIRRV